VQLAAAEQPAPAVEEAVRELTALADDLAFRADEDDRVQRFPPFIPRASIASVHGNRVYRSGGPTTRRSARSGDPKHAETAIPIDPTNARAIGPGEIQPEGILFMMDRFNVWVGSLYARAQSISLRKDEGQTFVEYALVLSVIVVGVLLLVVWSGLGTAIGKAIDSVSKAIDPAP
jgi:Flp pilus assembly pilin Flp